MTIQHFFIILFSTTVLSIYCQQFQYDSTEAKRLLGYDPDITIYQEDSTNPTAYPTIFVHGWGDNHNGFYQWKEEEHSILGPSIFYNLPDHDLQTNLFAFFKSSFGQWSDIAPTLYVLKKCRDAGYKRIDLFGVSRGGATLINLLDVLHNKKYTSALRLIGPSLKSVGIDEQARLDILQMIQAGCITIDAPIKHTYFTIKHMVNSVRIIMANALTRSRDSSSAPQTGHRWLSSAWFSHILSSKIGSAIDVFGAFIINYIALPIITKYKPWREQPLKGASRLNGLKLKILLNYERNDNIVHNHGNQQLYNMLHSLNPDDTYCVQSNDGGHCAPRKQLPEIFHNFKSVYGYCKNRVEQESAVAKLKEYNVDPNMVSDE